MKEELLDQRLVAYEEAVRAGVLRPTPVEAVRRGSPGSLVASESRLKRSSLAWLAAAAAVALLLLPFWKEGRLRLSSDPAADPWTNPLEIMVGLEDCFAGPGATASEGCSAFDLDSDGDVDMLDFRQVQLASRTQPQ
ncbi:MAG: hypothetical protein IT449_10560 [Phycisphaerales bacterium]|nr:hypothetical protein [Phycisphaerales bacterium]